MQDKCPPHCTMSSSYRFNGSMKDIDDGYKWEKRNCWGSLGNLSQGAVSTALPSPLGFNISLLPGNIYLAHKGMASPICKEPLSVFAPELCHA